MYLKYQYKWYLHIFNIEMDIVSMFQGCVYFHISFIDLVLRLIR